MVMNCPKCGSDKIVKHGFRIRISGKIQLYRCEHGHTFTKEEGEN